MGLEKYYIPHKRSVHIIHNVLVKTSNKMHVNVIG